MVGKLYVPDKECVKESFNISQFADDDYHTIKIVGKLYGKCTDESIVISTISFSSKSEGSLIPYDIFLDFLSWKVDPGSLINEEGILTQNSSAKYNGVFPQASKLSMLACGKDKAKVIFNGEKTEFYLNDECKEITLTYFPYKKFTLTLWGENTSWSHGYFQ